VRFPLLTSLLQLPLGNTEFDRVLHCVNVDDVSVLDEGDGSADLGLGCDMTDAEPMRPVCVCAEEMGLASCWRTGSGARKSRVVKSIKE
jgi:hypothetical protein